MAANKKRKTANIELVGALASLPGRVTGDGALPVGEARHAELARSFAASPEAQALEDTGYLPLLMELASSYLESALDDLDSSELRSVLFELVPRKISIEPSEARPLVEELRAFYAFLARERNLAPSAALQRVLGADAVPKLEAALADPSKFGPAKAFVMSGMAAGYDMDTREGIDAWMQVANSRASRPTQARPQLSQAKKAKRNAARKSRKKNR